MARSNGKGVGGALRTGYWFTASLAAFVVVCLIAAYAGESVHSSTVSLLQQTPVKGGRVAGEQIRRSNLATVEQVASSFKNNWADVAAEVSSADASAEVFSKQLKDLHSSVRVAARLTQATGGLIERPCAPTTTVKVGRGRTSTKCYYPTPPNGGGNICKICASGSLGYYDSVVKAQKAIDSTLNPACKAWRDVTASPYGLSSVPTVAAFGQALAFTTVNICEPQSVTFANGTTKYVIFNGPYCVDEADIASYEELAAIVNDDESTEAQYLAKYQQIQAAADAKCPDISRTSDILDATLAFSTLSRICNEDLPEKTVNLASGCNEINSA